jgi:hypothetical protein
VVKHSKIKKPELVAPFTGVLNGMSRLQHEGPLTCNKLECLHNKRNMKVNVIGNANIFSMITDNDATQHCQASRKKLWYI